jgi:hypothetical protein
LLAVTAKLAQQLSRRAAPPPGLPTTQPPPPLPLLYVPAPALEMCVLLGTLPALPLPALPPLLLLLLLLLLPECARMPGRSLPSQDCTLLGRQHTRPGSSRRSMPRGFWLCRASSIQRGSLTYDPTPHDRSKHSRGLPVAAPKVEWQHGRHSVAQRCAMLPPLLPLLEAARL